MKATIYLFKKHKFKPITSVVVDLPDDADENKRQMLAEIELFKQFEVEIIEDEI